jgi:hypothetical protein
MPLDAAFWMLLPAIVAAGSSLLTYYIMQARMDVAISKERETLAETRGEVRTWKSTIEERVRAAEEETRRKALDDFMQDFRVDERHYFRENHGEELSTRSMVLQERLYFRNLPLSNWVEHEMVVEENATHDLERLARGVSVFSTNKSLGEQGLPPNLLDTTKPVAVPSLNRAEAFDLAS